MFISHRGYVLVQKEPTTMSYITKQHSAVSTKTTHGRHRNSVFFFTESNTAKVVKIPTHYGSLLKVGLLGASRLCKWLYRTSKQKKPISGWATIPFLIPFWGPTVPLVPLQATLEELLSFCFLAPQQPEAMFTLAFPRCITICLSPRRPAVRQTPCRLLLAPPLHSPRLVPPVLQQLTFK